MSGPLTSHKKERADDPVFEKESSEFLTISEAATLLRIKKSTLYGWVHRRLISFRKHGRKVVFKKSDLERWSLDRIVESHSSNEAFEPLQIKKEKCYKRNSSLKTEYATGLEPTSRKEENNGCN